MITDPLIRLRSAVSHETYLDVHHGHGKQAFPNGRAYTCVRTWYQNSHARVHSTSTVLSIDSFPDRDQPHS